MTNSIEQATPVAKTESETFVLLHRSVSYEITTSDDLFEVLKQIAEKIPPSSVSVDNAIRGEYVHGLYRAATHFFAKDELDEMDLGGWGILDVNGDYLILIPEIIANATGVSLM
jgi:hypothetical protein